MSRALTALDLNRAETPAQLDWLIDVGDRAFALLRDWVAVTGEPERVDLSARFDRARSGLTADEDLAARATVEQELARGRELAVQAMQQEADRRTELASLVALVHEAVQAVGAEMTSMHTSVGESAGRFEAIAQHDDPRVIRARLVAEVARLKQAATERQRQWESTSKQFSQRLETLEDQLSATRNEAALDPLTGIANRRTFDRTCHEWIRSSRTRFVLALMDVDDFKGINDTHGHAEGDRVLLAIAQALSASVRPGDVVARLGGDEFAILAADLTLRQAESRFGHTIGTLCAKGAGELPCVPRLSCGLAEFSAGDTYLSLYQRSDTALYAAKRQGKHRVAIKERAFIRDLIRR